MDLVKKYPLDLTARNPNNLIIGEPHTLVESPTNGYRVFVPNYGGFYTDHLVVRDANGIELTPNVDYIATYLYKEATEKSGLEVCGAIVVKNPNVTADVYVDYHVVGGEMAFSVNALLQVLESLADETRPVEWAKIVGKPEYFPPGGHLHALWELYGFEYMVVQLERITQAIMSGNQAALDEIRDYAYRLYLDGKEYTDELDSRFVAFTERRDNPHAVTKGQVGLGNVDNFHTATLSEATDGTRNDRFVTPAGLQSFLDRHNASGDHDHRYVRRNASTEGSFRVTDGRLEAYISGGWRIVWPAQWVA